jgi:hypothetical protein
VKAVKSKLIGGIGLAAAVTLGAAACGSSHSSFHVESHPGDPNKIHTVAQFKSEQYLTVQSRVVVQAMQNNSLMAFGADVPADQGAVTDVLLADTHTSDLITNVVTQIANGCRTNDLSNAAYSSYINAPTAATCPTEVPNAPVAAPARAPAAAPVPAPVLASSDPTSADVPADTLVGSPNGDNQSTSLVNAVAAAGQGGPGMIVDHYVVTGDSQYAVALMDFAPGNSLQGDTATAYFVTAYQSWKMTTIGTTEITAQSAGMPQTVFDRLNNEMTTLEN